MVAISETWKDFQYGGLDYKINNKGVVIGCSRGRLLKIRLDDDGYPSVTLGQNDGQRSRRRVHRLVAEAFVDNPLSLPEVNHIDFDRTNNNVENLEWVTHQENIAYTVKHGRHVTHNNDYSGKNNPNYGSNTLKIKYANNPELAKINNSRKASQNGRAKAIRLLDINKHPLKDFDYIGECAEYLKDKGFSEGHVDTIRSNIGVSIKNDKPYLKHYYQFI